MCHHPFCDTLRYKRVKGEIQNNKFYIWIYTKKKKEFMACFFREIFGNYKVFTGLLRDIDSGCYQKCIKRLMLAAGIFLNEEKIEEAFRFDDAFISIFHKTPVFIAFLPILSKVGIQSSLQIYEKVELFTLYGDCLANKYKRNDQARLDIGTMELLTFSIEEEWIHKLPS